MFSVIMAEVSCIFRKGANRFMKQTFTHPVLEIEEKHLKRFVVAPAKCMVIETNKIQHENVKGQGSLSDQPNLLDKEPLGNAEGVICKEHPKVKGKSNINFFKEQDVCRQKEDLPLRGLSATKGDLFVLDVMHLINCGLNNKFDGNFCHVMSDSCHTKVGYLLYTMNWPCNNDLIMSRTRSQVEDPDVLNLLLHTQICVDYNTNVDWKKMTTFLGVNNESGNNGIIGSRQQKRLFCSMRTTETKSNIHNFLRADYVPVTARSYSRNAKDYSPATPLHKTKTAYYDILQVSPSATQIQIKTAYYKQSFIYHPDRNAGSEEATLRFSEISEAYTVLGNLGLKKKYDRGILSQADVLHAGRPSVKDARSSSTTAQQNKSSSSVEGISGKSVFDFDAFFQAHYSEQLQREKELRWRKEAMRKRQQGGFKQRKLGKMTEISVGILLTMGLAILLNMRSSN